jgi:chemotaxis protein CheD
MKPQPPLKNASVVLADAPSAETNNASSTNSQFLHAGQVFVSADAQPISLILGSCVAVCIWDSANAIGGATHYMLPSWDGKGVASPRYGNVAISILLQKLLEAGADRGQLCAKVFGGGCLFDSMREKNANMLQDLGRRNVEVALEMLAKARIPVVSTDVGLDRGKRIEFHTDSGKSVVKLL